MFPLNTQVRVAEPGSACGLPDSYYIDLESMALIKSATREKYGFSEDIIFIFVGRAIERKGLLIAVKAFEQYNKSLLPKRTSGSTLERIMQQNLIGTPTEIIEQVQALQEEGITHLIAQDFAVNSFQEFTDQLQLFGEEVMPIFISKDRLVK